MSDVETYLFLFFDSILSCLALVSNTTMVYNAMLVFGGYNKIYVTAVSLVGNVLGGSINYLLGRALYSIKKSVHPSDSKKMNSLQKYVNSRLFFLPIISFVTLLGVIITTLSGFFRLPYLVYISMFIVGRIIYYIYLLQ